MCNSRSLVAVSMQVFLISLVLGSRIGASVSTGRGLRVRGSVKGASRAGEKTRRLKMNMEYYDNNGKENIFAEQEQASSFEEEFNAGQEVSSDEELEKNDKGPEGMQDESSVESDDNPSSPTSPVTASSSSSSSSGDYKQSSGKGGGNSFSSNKAGKLAKKRSKSNSRSKIRDDNKLTSYNKEGSPLESNSGDDRPTGQGTTDAPRATLAPSTQSGTNAPQATPAPTLTPEITTAIPTRTPKQTDPPLSETPIPTATPTSQPTSIVTESLSTPTASPTQKSYWDIPDEPTEPTVNPYWEIPAGTPALPNDNTDAGDNTPVASSLVEWDCPSNIKRFQATIQVDFVGSPEWLTAEEIASLERTVSTLYNTETLLTCDIYTRTILDIELQLGLDGYVYDITATCRDCPDDTTLLQSQPATTTSTTRGYYDSSSSGGVAAGDDYFSQLGSTQRSSSVSPHSYYGFVEEVDFTEKQKGRGKGKGRILQQMFDNCYCPAGVEPTIPMAPTEEEFMAIQNEAVMQLREAGIVTNIEGISRLEEI